MQPRIFFCECIQFKNSCTLTLLHVTSHSEIDTSQLAGQRLFSQTMFSMLLFMCRDPGDIMTRVSCFVEPFSILKNAIIKVPVALPLKMSLTQKRKYNKS